MLFNEPKRLYENILFGRIVSVNSSSNTVVFQPTVGTQIRCKYDPLRITPVANASAVVGCREDGGEKILLRLSTSVFTPSVSTIYEIVNTSASEWITPESSLTDTATDFELVIRYTGLEDMEFPAQVASWSTSDFYLELETVPQGVHDLSLDMELKGTAIAYLDLASDYSAYYQKVDDVALDISCYYQELADVVSSFEVVEGSSSLTLTIDSSKVDSDLTNYPVLIHLSSSCGISDFDATAIFDELGSNYLKLSVKTSGDVECYVEIQSWDESAEEAWVWVKVPSVSSSSNTTLTLEYSSSYSDNTSYVGLVGSTAAQNVWDSNFIAVYHMDGTMSGVAATDDATSNGLDLTDVGTSSGTGLIGLCRQFSSDSTYMHITDATLDLDNATIQILYKDNGSQVQYATLCEKGTSYTNRNWWCSFNTSSYDWLRTSSSGSIGIDVASTAQVVEDGNWHDAAYRFNTDSTPIGYVDVDDTYSNSGSGSGSTPDGAGSIMNIGKSPTAGRYFAGWIDELRFSDIMRSDAWIAADHYCFNDSLVTVS